MSGDKVEEQKGVVGGIVGALGKTLDGLLPKVPAVATGVIVLVVAGMLVELGLVALGADTTSLVVMAALVVVAIVAVVYLLRDYQSPAGDAPAAPAAATAAGDTRALADRLSPDQHDEVCRTVSAAVGDAAAALGTTRRQLRGNVWACDGAGMLHILPEFNCNMTMVKERALDWPIGQGNVGRAWLTRAASIVDDAGADTGLAPDQRKRLHPDLTWVVSVPVFAGGQAGTEPAWILSVDGLKGRRTTKELQKVVGALEGQAHELGLILGEVAT
jgi:hypothetical protein